MKLLRRIRYLFHSKQTEADLAEEMQLHRELLAAENPADPLAAARAWGNSTLAREDARGVWLLPWLESFWKDFLYGVRALRREPGFTATAVGALAVALGLNISLFTVFNAIALRPWPVKDPARVVNVVRVITRGAESGRYNGFGVAEWRYLAARTKSFSGLILSVNLERVETAGRPANLVWVTANYFSVLGIDMARGRGFLPEEDAVTAPQAVAVLSYRAWRDRWGADPAIVGKSIHIDDIPFTIVGVAPESFPGTNSNLSDLWAPLSARQILRPHDAGILPFLTSIDRCCSPMAGRIAPGYTPAQAVAEVDLLMGQAHGAGERERGLTVTTTGTAMLVRAGEKGQMSNVLAAMFIAMTLVLLLACANVGNLLLARAAARRSEIAVRLSLGGSRLRLVRQLLVESLVLALAAAGIGLALATRVPAIMANLAPENAVSMAPDWRVCAYAMGMAVLACLVFGLAPALHGASGQIAAALKPGRGAGGRLRLRSFLLAAQVAISVTLLCAAGLMVRGLQRASHQDPGFRIEGVSKAVIELPAAAYSGDRAKSFTRELRLALDNASALPRIALTSDAPMSNSRSFTDMRLPSQPAHAAQLVQAHQVTNSYFDILRIPLVAGRNLTADDFPRAVAMVNETTARRLFGGAASPAAIVGKTIVANGKPWEIVGIAKDAFTTGLSQVQPAIYWPMTGFFGVPELLIDGSASPDLERIAALVRGIEPRGRVAYAPLSENFESRLAPARYAAMLAGGLGLLALALACIGISGVFAYVVRQRTREIGVRMALGARPGEIVRLVLSANLRSLVWGLTAGLAGSVAATRLLQSIGAGFRPFDPVAYAAVFAVLALGVAAATALPARRAARIDPLTALRWE